MLLPTYDCNTCTAWQKQERGCEQDAMIPLQMDGEDLWRCPRRPIFEEPDLWNEMLLLYGQYQEGRFPDDGGLNSQPAKYLLVMQAMSSAQAEAEKAREKAKTTAKSAGEA